MNALTRDLRTAAAKENPLLLEKMLHALIERWLDRREAARLSAYPDRMLKDIGVSRGGIPWAVRHGRRERALHDRTRFAHRSATFQSGSSKMVAFWTKNQDLPKDARHASLHMNRPAKSAESPPRLSIKQRMHGGRWPFSAPLVETLPGEGSSR